jgi:long-chain acyl-CoA synthetase
MLNLSTVFEYSAQANPDKTAIVFGEQKTSYSQLLAMINQVSNGLRTAGIKKGDKVALSCLNTPYFPLVYYAVIKVGAVVVPLNVLLKAREIEYHLKDSQSKAYFCFHGTPELPMAHEGYAGFQGADLCEQFYVITADPKAESSIEGTKTLGQLMAGQPSECDTAHTNSEDSAVILYTSGTTGLPRGAELSQYNMTMNALGARDLPQLTHDDKLIVVLPLFHSFGQTVMMNAGFSMGNTLIFIARFTPEDVLSAIQFEKVTVFAGVPTMYWALLNYQNEENKFDLDQIASNLRLGISGGSSMPLEIIKGIEEKYQIPILEGYGLSETSPMVTFNHLHKERKVGSSGVPVRGVEVKVVNEKGEVVPTGEIGEIIIRGHNVMRGYFNKPEATAKAINADGWFFSGDLGRLDEDGYLFIVDRIKDLIIRGGFNVYPREIEEVLMTHESITLASVVGVPHPQHGEEIKAFVVIKPGASITRVGIINWSKANMANYKYPRFVEIREALPMTATGKILKNELKAECSSS